MRSGVNSSIHKNTACENTEGPVPDRALCTFALRPKAHCGDAGSRQTGWTWSMILVREMQGCSRHDAAIKGLKGCTARPWPSWSERNQAARINKVKGWPIPPSTEPPQDHFRQASELTHRTSRANDEEPNPDQLEFFRRRDNPAMDRSAFTEFPACCLHRRSHLLPWRSLWLRVVGVQRQ